MNHTPGPWHVSDSNEVLDEESCLVVAEIMGERPEIYKANARLIAAAPELLEALKLIWQMFEDGRIVRNIANDHQPDWALKMLNFTRELQTIQLVIAKAEGVDPANGAVSAPKTSPEATQ